MGRLSGGGRVAAPAPRPPHSIAGLAAQHLRRHDRGCQVLVRSSAAAGTQCLRCARPLSRCARRGLSETRPPARLSRRLHDAAPAGRCRPASPNRGRRALGPLLAGVGEGRRARAGRIHQRLRHAGADCRGPHSPAPRLRHAALPRRAPPRAAVPLPRVRHAQGQAPRVRTPRDRSRGQRPDRGDGGARGPRRRPVRRARRGPRRTGVGGSPTGRRGPGADAAGRLRPAGPAAHGSQRRGRAGTGRHVALHGAADAPLGRLRHPRLARLALRQRRPLPAPRRPPRGGPAPPHLRPAPRAPAPPRRRALVRAAGGQLPRAVDAGLDRPRETAGGHAEDTGVDHREPDDGVGVRVPARQSRKPRRRLADGPRHPPGPRVPLRAALPGREAAVHGAAGGAAGGPPARGGSAVEEPEGGEAVRCGR